MNTPTLVGLWKDPASRAGSAVRHPAGEIDLLGGAQHPLARRAMLLSGHTAPSLGGTVLETVDTTTVEQTSTSLSYH
ncbi:hypothetical protein GCM10010441_70150 [Kitasatospora paracochleata]|uniref:Uncharacterized protein n=1 Tax=Kitasatospora paracochleata TaxID=58354 RepID=A0ABT1JB65_9ACTN|nr:hypothetical protein [Kitasatospora paracochleata]MCP2314326.1 hypothetical protein [Kitasatospora paracochleata]